MTSVRRNTYVLSKSMIPEPIESSGMDRQNLMRLKVNRIALVQELRVEHIITHLLQRNVIKNEDLKEILTGMTVSDRTRLFVDILSSKKKSTNWYRHFRDALLSPELADSNTCKKYKCLVEFLDNTIIHRPTSQGSLFKDLMSMPGSTLSRFNPLPPIQNNSSGNVCKIPVTGSESPNILKLHENDSFELLTPRIPNDSLESLIENKETKESRVLHTGHVGKGFINHLIPIPMDFKSVIEEPVEFFNILKESNTTQDQQQLDKELKTLENVQALELMCYLYKHHKLPDNVELCQTEAVEDILSRTKHYHRLTKYIRRLLNDHNIDLLSDLTSSYQHVIVLLNLNQDPEKIAEIVKLGFTLTDFLMELNYNEGAERTLIALMSFLNKHPKLETLMVTYKGYIKLMQLKNKAYDFQGVNSAYNRALEVTWQIEKVSFGQDFVEMGEMFLELSHLMLETGNINSAYSWSFKALQHVHEEERVTVVNVLCNAVMAYCSKWNIKRAELLAIQAVQIARKYFGSDHPLYVKALLAYCYYSNEFRQDETGVEMAKLTLKVANRAYGIETLQTAHAHRALCKALVVTENFHNEDYLKNANEALRIAKTYFTPNHPSMYLFHFTSAVALQWKALHVPFSDQEDILHLALSEVELAQGLIVRHFGDTSLRHAQILGLLGQISTKLGRLDVAESALLNSEKIMGVCLPPQNNYLLVAKTTLAMFYSMNTKQHSTQAKSILHDVIQALGSPGVLVKWVIYAFNHLIALHQSDKEEKEAKIVEAQLEEWLENNPPFTTKITPTLLMEQPKPYPEFLQDFSIWQKEVNRLKEEQ